MYGYLWQWNNLIASTHFQVHRSQKHALRININQVIGTDYTNLFCLNPTIKRQQNIMEMPQIKCDLHSIWFNRSIALCL